MPLISLYKTTYSTFKRSRRNNQNPIKSSCLNKWVICQEYPNGIYVNKQGEFSDETPEGEQIPIICLQTEGSEEDDVFFDIVDVSNGDFSDDQDADMLEAELDIQELEEGKNESYILNEKGKLKIDQYLNDYEYIPGEDDLWIESDYDDEESSENEL